ncbi:MAG: hypothetical protein SGJ15_09545 [Bacteroidota bacterium]|nr:hypothetical protein [Bacteroidota bacterium]
MKKLIALCLVSVIIFSCKKKADDPEPQPLPTTTTGASACPTCNFPDTVWTNTQPGPKLIFKFKFDSTQVRLNNLGVPASVGAGNGAYSPVFNGMSAHYIELAQNDLTAVGSGVKLYHAPETSCGGTPAIVHCQGYVVKDNEIFFSVPITPSVVGTYKWLRVSLAYQNYDIKVKTTSAGIIIGTIASFVGYNTYISKYKMHSAIMTPTTGGVGNHAQGYWGFYTKVFGVDYWADGQAPATTVVNPNASSPIPPGSCLVTGEFVTTVSPTVGAPLVITGSETSDIIITVSLSTNKSFEWNEITFDGYFQPEVGEKPVDMGIRGMIPKY